MSKLSGLKNIIDVRLIFLVILVLVMTFRFGTKMLEGYDAWDFFPTHYAAQHILEKGNVIYRDIGMSAQYTRSPIFALILYPLGLLPRNVASFIWSLLSTAALASIFILCEKLFVKDNRKRNLFWIYVPGLTLAFLSRPLLSQYLLGQVDFIMLAFIMFSLFFKEKGRLILSALFLVLAISIKLTPLIFLLYFLLKKEFKLCAIIVSFMAAFMFIPAIFVSWGQNLVLLSGWFHNLNLFYPHEATTPQDCWYQSLYFFYKRFVFSDSFNLSLFKAPPIFAQYLNYLTFAAMMTLLLIKSKKSIKDNGLPAQLIDYNILIISMTIFSPLAADYGYINLAVPIVFFLYFFKELRLYRSALFVVLAILFSVFNYFTGTKPFRMLGIETIRGQGYCYLVLMTVVWQALILLLMLFLLKFKACPERR